MEISSRSNREQQNNLDSSKGKGGFITLPFIVGSSIGLTLAAGSWHGNLTMYLTQYYNMNNNDATLLYNIMNIGVYSFSIIGALLADSVSGSFFIINTASFSSLLGLIMLCLSATIPSLRPIQCNNNNNNTNCDQIATNFQFAFLLVALSLATIGFGSTRFLLSSLGAFQFDKLKHRRNFFNAYIWAFAVSWAINYAVLGFVVQEKGKWKTSFGIGIAGNVVGIVLFLVGSKYFRHILPRPNPFLRKIWSLLTRLLRKSRGRNSVHDVQQPNPEMVDDQAPPKQTLRSPSQTSSKSENDNNIDMMDSNKSCSQKPQDVNEECWKVIKLIPASSAGVILNTAVATSSTLVVYQAAYMNLTIGPHIELPPESTMIVTLVFTAITVAIFDVFFFPMWERVVGRSMKPMQRGGTGQVVTIVGMIGLAAVEMARLETSVKGGQTLSVTWLIFPLALLGIGAGWYIPGGMTIHFQEFPDSLKCFSTALPTLPIGIGFYLSKAHINAVKGGTTWLPDDPNSGSLDRVYWILATIVALNFGYYLICAVYYRYYNYPDPNDPVSDDSVPGSSGTQPGSSGTKPGSTEIVQV